MRKCLKSKSCTPKNTDRLFYDRWVKFKILMVMKTTLPCPRQASFPSNDVEQIAEQFLIIRGTARIPETQYT